MDEYKVKFDHYDLGPVYYKDNRRCLYDPIREKLIYETQEEIIRQKFIKFLIEKLEVPQNRIEVEVPLSWFKSGIKGRADIVVYAEFDPGKVTPVIIVECKSPQVPLIDDVWYQVDKYDEVLGAGMVIVTNGDETYGGYYDNENGGYNLIQKLPTYDELLAGKVFFDPRSTNSPIWHRPSYDELVSDPNISDFKDYGWIGEDTDKILYPLIMNIAGLLNDQESKLLPNELEGLCIVEEGIRYTTFGNVGGGGYSSEYKYFIIQNGNKNNLMISIAILGTGKTVDDPFWGTRSGTTALIIGTDFEGKDHSSLQLNIDRYTTINNDSYELWHDGRLTVGNIGSMKRAEVVDYIKSRDPSLVDNNRIILGSFDKDVELTWEQENTRIFFSNIIKYAILRDELRSIKNKSRRKKRKRKRRS